MGAREIADRLTILRREALDEIGNAGLQGLGFGRCSLHKRRELIKMGLSERIPNVSMQVVREILTPLGLEVRAILQEQDNANR